MGMGTLITVLVGVHLLAFIAWIILWITQSLSSSKSDKDAAKRD